MAKGLLWDKAFAFCIPQSLLDEKVPYRRHGKKASFALPSLFGSVLPFFQTPAAVSPKEAELDEDCINRSPKPNFRRRP